MKFTSLERYNGGKRNGVKLGTITIWHVDEGAGRASYVSTRGATPSDRKKLAEEAHRKGLACPSLAQARMVKPYKG